MSDEDTVTMFRIEAETLDENVAEIFREQMERVPECDLTAFERIEAEGDPLREERGVQCSECGRTLDTADAEDVGDGRQQLQCECGNYITECDYCGEFVSVMAAKSGPEGKPVHAEHGVDGLD